MDEAMKKLLAELSASVKALNETVTAKFSSVNPIGVDAEKEKLASTIIDLQKQVDEIKKGKAIKKMLFQTGDIKAGEGERAVTFGQFIKAVGRGDHEFLSEVKAANGQSETDADGGYAVPDEFGTKIIELQQIYGVARRIAAKIPMGTAVRTIPRQLTRPTATYTAEAVNGTKTKVTLDVLTQTAKKLMAIVPFTNELLADNNVGMDTVLFGAVARAFGRAEDTQAFIGSGSPFTGVYNGSGVNTATMVGGSLAWEDVVNLMFAVNGAYRQNGIFVLSSDALKAVMKLRDDENRPIWSMPVAGQPGSILGKRYEETDAITSTLGDGSQTAILFGDFSGYLYLSDRSGYEVSASDSASDANAGAGSAFLQDEVWFRFKQRHSIDVALGEAFSRMLVNAS